MFKRIGLAGVATIAAAGALSAPTFASDSAAGAAKATGDIGWTTAAGYDATAQFVAIDAQPARGNVTVTNHDNVSFTGAVSCYADLGGGVAEFGGPITSSSYANPALGNVDGESLSYFFMIVKDNGEPGNASATDAPDRITLYRPATAPDCVPGSEPAGLTSANQSLSDGNLVVH